MAGQMTGFIGLYRVMLLPLSKMVAIVLLTVRTAARAIIVGLSFVLVAGSVFMWVRSYPAYDRLRWFHSKPFGSEMRIADSDVRCGEGRLLISIFSGTFFEARMSCRPRELSNKWELLLGDGKGIHRVPKASLGNAFGFYYERRVTRPRFGTFSDMRVVVPYWAFFFFGCLWPMYELFAKIGVYMRKRQGLCAACGYDVRASFEYCPECGSRISMG